MGSAFTVKYKNITQKLTTDIEITNNGNSIQSKALWDTGATDCCISKQVANSLALVPTGRINIHTPSGTMETNTYLVDIKLPNDVEINDVLVADSEIGAQQIGLLIGMNIISQGDLAVGNHSNVTTFSFRMPSVGVTDYVKQIKASNIIGKPHGKGKRKKKIT